MAFITEYASKEDIEKYHLDELQKKYHLANPGLDWTHDKERDVFLMFATKGRGEESQRLQFLLSRKGEIYFYDVWQFFDRENKTIEWEMQIYGKPEYKSEEDRQKWEAIHADLREALRSYGLAGSLIPDNEGFNNARFVNF